MFVTQSVATGNVSSESRAKFFAFCFGAVYLFAIIVAIVPALEVLR